MFEVACYKPNFLIVGAPRSGTTSLYEWLRQHPQVFMPDYKEHKEPSYFVNGYGIEDLDSYLSLFEEASGKLAIGEASTHYLYCKESAEWIKSVLGSIKIIIMLRNPVERAFSLYIWMVQEGFEDARTFEDALAREPERIQSSEFQRNCPVFFADYLYYHTGLYFEPVKRYFDIFGRSNVRVYLLDDLGSDPRTLCRDVFEFLGVDTRFAPDLKAHNRGVKPRSIRLQYWLRTKVRDSIIERFLPRTALMALNVRLGTRPKMHPATLRTLQQRYRDNVTELAKLLDKDLSSWIESH